jgi:hypothetical protein
LRDGLFFTQSATFEVTGVAAVMKIRATSVEFEHSIGDAIKYVSIVGHEYESAAVTIESIFEPCDRINVKVIRRFVKNEQVARSDKGTCKGNPFGLAA